MKAVTYLFAALILVASIGCEKTIHEVRTPLPIPSASMAMK